MIKSLTLISLVFLTTVSFSQETKKVEAKPTQVAPRSTEKQRTSTVKQSQKNSQAITISKKAGEPQRVHDEAYYNEEISKIDNHLDAINQKIEFINNDPTEKAKAIEGGWFEDMDNIKRRLNSKKKIYQEKLSK